MFFTPVAGGRFGIGGNDVFTKLLLHCDGTDGSTLFPDASASAHTVTASGNAQIDTAQSKFGGESALFDGTGDYLRPDSSADFAMGTGDFTIDTWARFSTLTDYRFIWSPIPGLNTGLQVSNPTDGKHLQWNNQSGTTTTGTSVIAINTWYHFAFSRSGTSNRIFVNGVLETTVSDGTNYGTSATRPYLGIFSNGSSYGMVGWIDEFRVSKGIARWIANFIPPDQPYS